MKNRSQYVWMYYISAPGQERLIKNEYDFRVINSLLTIRAMMVPITPRLGAFVDPRKTSAPLGVLTTPMVEQPRRLYVRGRMLIVAFHQQRADSMSMSDLNKFKKFWRAVEVSSPIPEAEPISGG